MHRRSEFGNWYITSLLCSVLLLIITACASDTPAPEPNRPTEELAVVVFATEAPTPTPVEPTDTSTPAPTVGFGVASNNIKEIASTPAAAQTTEAVSSEPDSRPADVNPLTGLKVDDPAVLRRRPIMVRVGNDPEARPQVGLDKADVVYEEITEWWITRFTAIYLSQDPEMIAPIRSARLINLQLVPQYQGALANSGGSDQVRWELSQSDIVNLDEFFVPGPYFYRENEGWQTRLAFDATAARDYLNDEGLDSDVNLRGFVFAENLDLSGYPQDAVGDAEEVIVPYPQTTSVTTWQYDPASGKYLRFITGDPLLAFDGSQIAASNVIIYFAEHLPTDIVEDSNGATSIRIVVNGLGTAWLLRDGKFLKGNWETDGRQTPNFIFNDGRSMPLKPGNTWIEVVPTDYLIEIDGVSHARLDSAQPDAAGASSTESGAEPAATPTLTPTPIGARPAQIPTPTAAP